jgi:RNA polymerase sigma factor (sigma-70 family)
MAEPTAKLDEVFTQFQREMAGKARKMLKAAEIPQSTADADDIVNTAVLRALEYPDKLREPRAFLYAVMRREVDRLAQKRALHASLERYRAADPLRWDGPLVVPDFSARSDTRAAVVHALRLLPVQQRSAVWATDALDYTREETADALGRHPGTVAQHVWRARASLHSLLTLVVGILLVVAAGWKGCSDGVLLACNVWVSRRDKDKNGKCE